MLKTPGEKHGCFKGYGMSLQLAFSLTLIPHLWYPSPSPSGSAQTALPLFPSPYLPVLSLEHLFWVRQKGESPSLTEPQVEQEERSSPGAAQRGMPTVPGCWEEMAQSKGS